MIIFNTIQMFKKCFNFTVLFKYLYTMNDAKVLLQELSEGMYSVNPRLTFSSRLWSCDVTSLVSEHRS